jgi:hypothetical protein
MQREEPMLQQTTTFDLRGMIDGSSTKSEIYTFFFMVAIMVTAAKVVRVWKIAPPFRLSRQASNPAFLVTLENSVHSLKRWSECALLGWGLLTALTITDLCSRLFYERTTGWPLIVSFVRELSVALTMAILIMLFSLFARWHMLKRIESLRGQASQTILETDKPSR